MNRYLRDCWDQNRMWFWKWVLEFYVAVIVTILLLTR